MELNKDTIVVWDGDNTLWDWLAYAGPAYTAMCHKLAELSGKHEDEVAQAMTKFYTRMGTLEHEGLVQDLFAQGLFKELPLQEQAVILKVHGAFARARNKHFLVYEGIQETVQALTALGVRQVVVTDATGYQALSRFSRSGLKGFESIWSQPIPKVEGLPPMFGTVRRRTDLPPRFDLSREKPNVDLGQILGLTAEEVRRRVAVAGDNKRKDGGMAEQNGCPFVHTQYGVRPLDDSSVQQVLRFAPRTVAQRNMADPTPTGSTSRSFTAQDPSEIVKMLERA